MITVFTPTFNRYNELIKCYESLIAQTNKNFVWMIIDDGSNDNSNALIKEFIKESKIEIFYHYQVNSGKYIAFNRAIDYCTTDYMLILDSDDSLDPKAIEILESKTDLIANDEMVSGIIGNMFDVGKNGINGDKMPIMKYVSGLELYQLLKFTGDTLRLYKTKILKKFKFPEIPNEKFMPENVMFDRIDERYKMLVIKEILYYSEYLNDGLSNRIYYHRKNNPISYSLSLKSSAETALKFRKKVNFTILYIIWCKNFKISGFDSFKLKSLYILLHPISMIFNIFEFPRFLFKSINYE